jgi:hypothetical protein
MRLFLLFFFVSCSTNIIQSTEIKTFVRRFEEACNRKVTIPIYWGDLHKEKDGQVIGVCRGFQQFVMFRSIVLDREYWSKASYWDKESLIFHELGHCVLDRPHVLAFDDDLNPMSIMHPYTFHSYFSKRAKLVKELCGPF